MTPDIYKKAESELLSTKTMELEEAVLLDEMNLKKYKFKEIEIPKVSGIYFIFGSNDELLYIGQTVNLNQRLYDHFTGQTNTKNAFSLFENFSFILIDEEKLLQTEKELISRYNPPYCQEQGRKPIGITRKGSLTLEGEMWGKIEEVQQERNMTQSAVLRSIIEEHYQHQEDTRSKMWWELIKKNVFEGYIEIKESQVKECIQHWKYPNELKAEVWKRCKENSKEQGYKKVGVKLLLDAFLFEGNRLQLDKSFASIEEQIIFSIIRYVWMNDKSN